MAHLSWLMNQCWYTIIVVQSVSRVRLFVTPWKTESNLYSVFCSFASVSLFCCRITSRDIMLSELSCLLRLLLTVTVSWNFLVLDDFNRLTVRYFIECHSIGICLMFFVIWLGYGFWGRKTTVIISRTRISTWLLHLLERRVFIIHKLFGILLYGGSSFLPHLSNYSIFYLYVLMNIHFILWVIIQ